MTRHDIDIMMEDATTSLLGNGTYGTVLRIPRCLKSGRPVAVKIFRGDPRLFVEELELTLVALELVSEADDPVVAASVPKIHFWGTGLPTSMGITKVGIEVPRPVRGAAVAATTVSERITVLEDTDPIDPRWFRPCPTSFKSRDRISVIGYAAFDGDLFGISNDRKSLRRVDGARLLATIARVLQVVHEMRLFHLDIKVENILFRLPDDGSPMTYALGDWGCSYRHMHNHRADNSSMFMSTTSHMTYFIRPFHLFAIDAVANGTCMRSARAKWLVNIASRCSATMANRLDAATSGCQFLKTWHDWAGDALKERSVVQLVSDPALLRWTDVHATALAVTTAIYRKKDAGVTITDEERDLCREGGILEQIMIPRLVPDADEMATLYRRMMGA